MKKENFLKIVLLLGDIFAIYISLFLALTVRNNGLVSQFNSFFYSSIALYVLWIVVIFILNLYSPNFFKNPIDFLFSVIVFSVLAFFLGVTYFYFCPIINLTPKTILLLNILIFDIIFLLWRYLFNLLLESKGIKEKIIIVGFHEKLEEILPQIKNIYDIIAIFCPLDIDSQKKCSIVSSDSKIISEIRDLKNIVEEKNVTSVIFALDFYSNKDLVKKIFTALPLTLTYLGVDNLYESLTKKISLDFLDEIWLLKKISKPEDKFEKIIKRSFDIIFSFVALVIFFIFFPFIAAIIKIEDRGSIFYIQKRAGKNGKDFFLYKFRTMYETNGQHKDTWREKNKDNITKFGKFLRKSHLDELPQAWNILKGEMSFVGPRAEWVELARVFETEIPFYKQRYLVKPGLFGWAQINFPASKSVDEAKEKFEYDLYYIKNHSSFLDLEIIFKSIKLFMW